MELSYPKIKNFLLFSEKKIDIFHETELSELGK